MYKNLTVTYDVRGLSEYEFKCRAVITSVIMEERAERQGVTCALAPHVNEIVFSLPSVPGRYIIQNVMMPKGSKLVFSNSGVAFLICEAMVEV